MRSANHMLGILSLVVFAVADALAGGSDSSFFPLRIGNQWRLVNAMEGGSAVERIVDTTRRENDLYYRFDTVRYETNVLYRLDGAKVYRYVDTSAALWYDFSADSGATWPIPEKGVQVTVESTRDTVSVPAGSFSECRRFFFFIGPDAAWTEWFAKGVGLVKRVNITIAGAHTWDLSKVVTTSVRPNGLSGQLSSFRLEQNYPNPFNPSTVIRFSVPPSTEGDLASGRHVQAVSYARLTVYDQLGREVETLVDGIVAPGGHEVVWTAKNLASGVYFYRLQVGSSSVSRKMLFIQ